MRLDRPVSRPYRGDERWSSQLSAFFPSSFGSPAWQPFCWRCTFTAHSGRMIVWSPPWRVRNANRGPSAELNLVLLRLVRPLQFEPARSAMDNEGPNRSPSSRDVAGAWLFCLIIALLGLAMTTELPAGIPAAAELTTWSACVWMPDSNCRPAPEATNSRPAAVAGLHRGLAPVRRTAEPHRAS